MENEFYKIDASDSIFFFLIDKMINNHLTRSYK